MDTIDKINYYLVKQGKTGADLSRALGLSNSIYSQWNKKKTKPKTSKLSVIAEYLGVSVADILPDDEEVLPKAKKESAPDPKTEGVKKAHATEGEDYTELQKAAIQFVLSLPPEKLERFIKMGRAAFEEDQ
nr:MAG TPA: SOS-response transcriptional repressor [Caudoviricetes sp.]DAJ26740.1 MAG TPA: SOS-response transcriptional repressor [Caudoviricetes sp.]